MAAPMSANSSPKLRARAMVDDEAQAVGVIRAGTAIAMVFLFAYLLTNLMGAPGVRGTPILEQIVAILGAGLMLAATGMRWFAAYRKPAVMLCSILSIALFLRIGVARGDSETCFLSILLVSLAAASFAGWGWSWQAGLNLLCLVVFVATEAVARPPVSYRADRWFAMGIALALSQAIAIFLERYRRLHRAQLAALQDAAAFRERQAATLVHDIRNPLGALAGFVGLLEDGQVSGDEQSELFGRIGTIVRRMDLLVGNMVELYRIEDSRIQPNLRDVNPDSVAAEIALGYRAEASRRHVALVTELGCKSQVSLDPFHLERIIANLLANALARSAGGEIRLATAIAGNNLRIEVADPGPAPSPGELAGMFERPDPDDRQSGPHRLGLYIVRTLVHMYGGTIKASSSGTGLKLSAEIPLGAPPLKDKS